MAEQTKKTALTAAALREMTLAEQTKLLADKRVELREALVALKAQELANPRRVKELRRNIALILTIHNEKRDSSKKVEETK